MNLGMTAAALASRPWRNRSPGDLRTLPGTERWLGQVNTDHAAGGPFAVFSTAIDGWRALAKCLLTYQDVHGLNTVRAIIGRFAPAEENDTDGYVHLVAGKIGRGADDTISLHDAAIMLAFVRAIALAEGGARLLWPQADVLSGLALLGLHPPPPAKTINPVEGDSA